MYWISILLLACLGRFALSWTIAIFSLLLIAIPAQAEKRVALVIGNSAYAEVPVLPNPVHDADAMAATFTRLGFDVTLSKDLTKSAMERGLADFSDKAAAADLAVVFYAGHGIELNGRNYLIPVDARLKADNHVKFEAVSLDDVLDAIDDAKMLKLVLLDACRDSPFTNKIKRSVGTRSIGRGLAKVETRPGVLVSYAAAAGTTASDGDGGHSPYTEALLATLEQPGLELSLMFRKVADHVQTATNGNQTPFEYGRLPGMSIYLKDAEAVETKAAEVDRSDALSPADPDTCRDAAFHWAAIQNEDNTIFFEDHLKRFGSCSFSTLAQARLDATRKAEADKLAALQKPIDTPSEEISATAEVQKTDIAELAREIQIELGRLGCTVDGADGKWGRKSERALARFSREAKQEIANFDPSEPTLKILRDTEKPVCAPECAAGQDLRDGICIARTCDAGQIMTKKGNCVTPKPTETNRKKVVRRREHQNEATPRRHRREVVEQKRNTRKKLRMFHEPGYSCVHLCGDMKQAN